MVQCEILHDIACVCDARLHFLLLHPFHIFDTVRTYNNIVTPRPVS